MLVVRFNFSPKESIWIWLMATWIQWSDQPEFKVRLKWLAIDQVLPQKGAKLRMAVEFESGGSKR